MPRTHRLLKRALAASAAALLATSAAHAQVGFMNPGWTITHPDGRSEAVPSLIFYPTNAAASSMRLGPFEVVAKPGAAPTPGRHPLVVISHGTGGNELAHAWLAQALAADGYVVLALRHPGDNYQDRSAVARSDYFSQRPRQVTQVLDAVLADTRWRALIDTRRIAAIGHSAGGHTVLALAGGRPDRARVLQHCAPLGAGWREDAAMCRLGDPSVNVSVPVPATDAPARAAPVAPAVASAPTPALAATAPTQPMSPPTASALPDVTDARIRAVLAFAPLGIALQPASLAAITLPVALEWSEADEVLAYKHHGQALCAAMPKASCEQHALAGHYAAFHPGTGRLGVPGLDPSEDPQGFDRRAWQALALQRVRAFLARNLGL